MAPDRRVAGSHGHTWEGLTPKQGCDTDNNRTVCSVAEREQLLLQAGNISQMLTHTTPLSDRSAACQNPGLQNT